MNNFAVNVNLFPMMRPFSIEDMLDAVHEEGVKIIETSGRSPEPYMEAIKRPGVVHMHKCARVKDAVKAEKIGADMVSIVGLECGGHPSSEEVTTMVIVPRTVDSIKVPVLAGGGIADGRGFLAALVLGAEGVVIGTRFMATKECPLHPVFKDLLLKADIADTTLLLQSHGAPLRAYRNSVAVEVREMEARGEELTAILPLMSGLRGWAAYQQGATEGGIFPCGQAAGLVHEIKTVQEVVDEIIGDARAISQRLKF